MKNKKSDIVIQLRFTSSRVNTQQAEFYVRHCDDIGYKNRTKFVEDAIVEFYRRHVKNSYPRQAIDESGTVTDINVTSDTETASNSEYEEALKYFEEKRKKMDMERGNFRNEDY